MECRFKIPIKTVAKRVFICSINLVALGVLYSIVPNYLDISISYYILFAIVAVPSVYCFHLRNKFWEISNSGILTNSGRFVDWAEIKYVREIPTCFGNLTIIYHDSARVLEIPLSVVDNSKFRQCIGKYAPKGNGLSNYVANTV